MRWMRTTGAEPLELLERGLRVLRALTAVLLIVAASTARSATLVAGTLATSVGIGAAVLLLLVANVWSQRVLSGKRSHPANRVEHAVLGGLTADTIAALIVVVMLSPSANSFAWLGLLLPVLEAALRYRVTGAALTWGVMVTAVALRQGYSWDAETGLAQLQALVRPLTLVLVVALPLGYLAEQLVTEVDRQRRRRSDAQHRAHLLGVLLQAHHDLTDLGADRQCLTVVEAARGLGCRHADVWHLDGDGGWHPRGVAHDGTPTALPPPGDAERAAMAAGTALPRRGPGGQAIGGGAALADGSAGPVLYPITERAGQGSLLRVWMPAHTAQWDLQDEALSVLTAHAANTLSLADLLGEVEQHRAELAEAIAHDNLTGLLNRYGLMSELTTRITLLHGQASAAGGEAAGLGVLLLDLDGFKAVNDTAGHAAGDQVLRRVAAMLSALVPPGTVVARLGGDEFVILMVAEADPRAQAASARALAGHVRNHLVFDADGLTVRTSVGWTVGLPGDSASAVLHRADQAMYDDKQARRLLG